jgi:tripartite-type tricarboxylate transporter receptor subunit TctC
MKYASFMFAGLAAAAMSLPGTAVAKYPEKPITFIVPFGAGSSFSALARKLGQRWEKELGVSIVVKPTPGSGGRRGGIRIYKSKPDGYTIGWTHFVPFLSDTYLRGKKSSIDLKKVAIVYQIAASQFYMFVNKKSPYKSLADLKNLKSPLKFASTGIGAITWVQASALGATLGFPVKFVLGYKKLGDAALAVAKGDAVAGVGGAVHTRGVQKDLRPLMFFGPSRDRFFPDVPSAGELGYTKLTNLGAPRVVTAPPGTPEAILKVLRAAAIRATKDKEFVDWATKTGFYINPQGPAGTWKGLDAKTKIFKELKPLLDKATKKK